MNALGISYDTRVALQSPPTSPGRPTPGGPYGPWVSTTPEKRIVNYCGGGVSATIGFFTQTLMCYADIAVYNASMNECGANDNLPMEQGQTSVDHRDRVDLEHTARVRRELNNLHGCRRRLGITEILAPHLVENILLGHIGQQ
jgi:hypothetical protein